MGGGLHPDVIDYQQRVIAAGGSFQSGDITIVNTFVNNLVSNNIWSKIKDCGIYFGGWLGSNVKLKYADALYQTLTYTNFVSGDYSESVGLSANTANRKAATNIVPSNYGLSSTNFSWGIYVISNIEQVTPFVLGGDTRASGANNVAAYKNGNLYSIEDDGSPAATVEYAIVKNGDPYFLAYSFGTHCNPVFNYLGLKVADAPTPRVIESPKHINSGVVVMRPLDSKSLSTSRFNILNSEYVKYSPIK